MVQPLKSWMAAKPLVMQRIVATSMSALATTGMPELPVPLVFHKKAIMAPWWIIHIAEIHQSTIACSVDWNGVRGGCLEWLACRELCGAGGSCVLPWMEGNMVTEGALWWVGLSCSGLGAYPSRVARFRKERAGGWRC